MEDAAFQQKSHHSPQLRTIWNYFEFPAKCPPLCNDGNMSISQLKGDTIRLISCSQVITSVHSVVKELVENSLDANASSINIRLENFGLDVIEVKDNGSGVSRENVKFMALPHSTSKISSFDDLCTLETYGFRGEALHSVATMAMLSVTTRTEGESVAYRYQFSSQGEVVSCKPAAHERGTTLTISNLFQHFPVRRQCYKSSKRCKEELKKVEDYLLAYGLAHPEVRFQLRHNKLTLWQKPTANNFEANVQTILGSACFQKMAPINYQRFDPMVKIQALVPKPHEDLSGITRSTAERMFLLVNKRPVEIKTLLQLVKQAFAKAFPSLSVRYPIAVVSISVMPQALDINLEPNKTSLLLHDLEFIISTLESLLEQVYSPCLLPAEDAPTVEAQPPALEAPTAEAPAVEIARASNLSTKQALEKPRTPLCEEKCRTSAFEVEHRTPACEEPTTPPMPSPHENDRSHTLGLLAQSEKDATELPSAVLVNGAPDRQTQDKSEGGGSKDCHETTGGEKREEEKCCEADYVVVNGQQQLSEECCEADYVVVNGQQQLSEECCEADYVVVNGQQQLSEECCKANYVMVNGQQQLSEECCEAGHAVVNGQQCLSELELEEDIDFEQQLLEESASSFMLSEDELTSEFFAELDKEVAEAASPLCGEKEVPKAGALVCGEKEIPSQASSFQTSLSQWSRGINLKQQKQPVKLCHPGTVALSSPPQLQPKKSKLIPKRPSPVFDLINSHPVKRKSPSSTTPTPHPPKRLKLASDPASKAGGGAREVWTCTGDCQASFDMAGVMGRCRAMAAGHPPGAPGEPPDRAVGWCELTKGSEKGVWLVVHNSAISCFNVTRAREEIDSLESEEMRNNITTSDVQFLLNKSSDKNHLFHVLHQFKLP